MIEAGRGLFGSSRAEEVTQVRPLEDQEGQGVYSTAEYVQAATDGQRAYMGRPARSRSRDNDIKALRHTANDTEYVCV